MFETLPQLFIVKDWVVTLGAAMLYYQHATYSLETADTDAFYIPAIWRRIKKKAEEHGWKEKKLPSNDYLQYLKILPSYQDCSDVQHYIKLIYMITKPSATIKRE